MWRKRVHARFYGDYVELFRGSKKIGRHKKIEKYFRREKKLVPHEPLEDASAEEKIDYLATGCFEMLRPLRNHARDILVHLEVEEEKDKYMDVIMDLDTNYLFPATVRLLNRHDGDGASILKEMPFTVQTLVSKVIETKRFLSLDENQALALYAAHRECEEIWILHNCVHIQFTA